MSKTIERIKADLGIAIPHFRYMLQKAKAQGNPEMLMVAVTADGDKKVVGSFQCEEFFDDLATLIGVGPQTAEDNLNSSAAEFAQKLRAQGITVQKTEIGHE